MRHQNKTVKLGRSQAHRDALLANQVCSLIIHQRIRTALAKALIAGSLFAGITLTWAARVAVRKTSRT